MPEFDSRQSIQRALDLLTRRLDLILAKKLASLLDGHPWTVILVQLDQMKGYTPKAYGTGDLQAQLRMITEKLGTLGFPFDTDNSRVVSTIGNELRIMRNRWAHNDEFSVLDAWRAHDFVYRLLNHFEDQDGVGMAQSDRLEALAAAAKAEGVTMVQFEKSSEYPLVIQEMPPSLLDDGETDHVALDTSMLIRSDSLQSLLIGPTRSEFVPWTIVPVGDVGVLDDLPKKSAKEKVRAVAMEIAEFEGPIHLDRLASLVAACFGLNRLHSPRRKNITYQIKKTGLDIDGDKFVWPSAIDRCAWSEFRPNDSDCARIRRFQDVSPVEVSNAARFLKARDPSITAGELESAVLRTFGRKRRSKRLREHLAKGLALAESDSPSR